MSVNSPVRLGLVGAGAWGRNYISTLKDMPEIQLVAVVSRNPDTRKLMAPDCEQLSDWRQLMDMDIDGAIIATPPDSHVSIASEFVAANKAVLIEKPLSLDLTEAEAFAQLVKAHSGIAVVNHIHLFNPVYRQVKEISALLGLVKHICSSGGREGPFRADCSSLWDWGPHDVAMVLDIVGSEPESVEINRLHRQRDERGLAENYHLQLGFAEDVVADIHVGNDMDPVRRLEIDHVNGTLMYDDRAEEKLTVKNIDDSVDRNQLRAILSRLAQYSPLNRALSFFQDMISAGSPRPDLVDFAVSVTRVLNHAHTKQGL